MNVTDEDSTLSSSMMTKAKNTLVKERLWINRVASEIVFQSLHPNTGAPLHEERVTGVREEANLHLEFYLQGVTDGMRSPWKLLVGGLEESSGSDHCCEENREHITGMLLGLISIQVPMRSVITMRVAGLLNEVRQPETHVHACLVTDCDDFIER